MIFSEYQKTGNEFEFYAAYEDEGEYKVGIFTEHSADPYWIILNTFKNILEADIIAKALHSEYERGYTDGANDNY